MLTVNDTVQYPTVAQILGRQLPPRDDPPTVTSLAERIAAAERQLAELQEWLEA